MSVETGGICDIVGCDRLARDRLEHVTVASRDLRQTDTGPSQEDGLFIWTSHGVDLCGQHENAYRSNLPQIKLKQMEKK